MNTNTIEIFDIENYLLQDLAEKKKLAADQLSHKERVLSSIVTLGRSAESQPHKEVKLCSNPQIEEPELTEEEIEA